MKKCYIVGAGEFYGSFQRKDGDVVIAADGGLLHLLRLGIKPDIVLGDFDSLGEDNFSASEGVFGGCNDALCIKEFVSGARIIRYPVEKDETDTYLAYRIGAELGCDEFHIYGGVGGREDHTFANYCLLVSAKSEGKQTYLYNNNSRVYAIKSERIELVGKEGKTVSIFAFGTDATGVSVKGLKYEAENITVAADNAIGVSNSHTSAGKGYVSVLSGTLLVFEEL